MRTQIPENEVVVSAVACQLVPLGFKGIGQRLGILDNVLRVCLEVVRRSLEQLHSEASNLVVVGTTLQAREDSHIDALLDVGKLVSVLEEDHTRARSTEGFVSCGRNHIAVREGRWVISGSH